MLVVSNKVKSSFGPTGVSAAAAQLSRGTASKVST
jgi:hypothetical protein